VNEQLKDWPEWGLHISAGFSQHKGFTHMARKARAQMVVTNPKVRDSGLTSLWVMAKEIDKRDEVEAVMVAVFFWAASSQITQGVWVPSRNRAYVSATLNLPRERRLRSGTAMLKRCEDCIQELMIWHKMETS